MKEEKYNPLWTRLLWAAAVMWVGVLFYLSTQTAAQSGELSGWFTSVVVRVLRHLNLDPSSLETVLRKIAHFCIFAFEGFLLVLAMLRTVKKPRRAVIVTALVCMAMAAANETSQLFASGRSCELRDMLIDFGGALLGVLVGWLLHRIVRRHVMIQ